MKIVIISASVYPSLTPRAQRTTNLAEEFARKGHDVTVYAILGHYNYEEYSRLKNVRVINLSERVIGYPNSDGIVTINLYSRIINALFGKWFWLPDRRIIPWVKKAIKREGNINLLITIAVPHVLHYATSLSDLSKIDKWIADCGDPFTLNPYTKDKMPGYLVSYEKRWCRKCDFITVPTEESKNGYYPEFRNKIQVIPQGYNFAEITLRAYKKHDIPTFAYAGAVYKGLRDPEMFLDYLVRSKRQFHLTVFGPAWAVFSKYVDKVEGAIVNGGFLPRKQLIPKLGEMDFLINIKNNSGVQQPSKLIDYGLSKRPIVTISSDFDKTDQDNFESFCNGDYSGQTLIPDINSYDIDTVSNQFLGLVYNCE